MEIQILTIVVEHFLVMRGLPAHMMRDSIPYAEAIAGAANPDGVTAILEAMLQDFDLPVEDTIDYGIEVYNYARALCDD